MQNKPNFPNAQILVNCVLTMDYVNIRLRSRWQNKANQTQFQTQRPALQEFFPAGIGFFQNRCNWCWTRCDGGKNKSFGFTPFDKLPSTALRLAQGRQGRQDRQDRHRIPKKKSGQARNFELRKLLVK
jgi:hypothetical protein